MKNKSKKRRLWEQVKYRLNSTYRGMVVRMMVGSKEQVGGLLIGCMSKNSVIGRWQQHNLKLLLNCCLYTGGITREYIV